MELSEQSLEHREMCDVDRSVMADLQGTVALQRTGTQAADLEQDQYRDLRALIRLLSGIGEVWVGVALEEGSANPQAAQVRMPGHLHCLCVAIRRRMQGAHHRCDMPSYLPFLRTPCRHYCLRSTPSSRSFLPACSSFRNCPVTTLHFLRFSWR